MLLTFAATLLLYQVDLPDVLQLVSFMRLSSAIPWRRGKSPGNSDEGKLRPTLLTVSYTPRCVDRQVWRSALGVRLARLN